MNRKKHLLLISKIINVLQIIISFLIIIGLIISIPDIFKYYYMIITSDALSSYGLLQSFLEHVLLIMIGVEFVLMIVSHSDNSIIYLTIFVIARKLLIKSDTMVDVMIGVIAISILFFVKKYLVKNSIESENNAGVVSAASSIDTINKRFDYNIDDFGFQSIGGLVYYLLQQRGLEVVTGEIVDDKDYIYQVEKSNNGIIESVTVQKNKTAYLSVLLQDRKIK